MHYSLRGNVDGFCLLLGITGNPIISLLFGFCFVFFVCRTLAQRRGRGGGRARFTVVQVALTVGNGVPMTKITENDCYAFYLLYNCSGEWSFDLDVMEVCAENSHSNGKQTLKHSKSADEVKRSNDKAHRSFQSSGKQNLKQATTFINHAAIAWHEDRRKWVGDKSQHPPRTAKDPIISWSTSYEELLSTNEPFAEPIPLPEMVDFLVDIWHDDEGLFD
ncbi:hypothetical protein VNO77_12969 [Canavalia gladiata]|uniref:Gag1-like clamp domain-containing protein n=1 Tax=Canavalia gladiata TaxID=3824 RepID=A0AAN9LXD0_CANGL